MVPFAIAGVQMPVPAMHDNIAAMIHRIDVVAARFPWVQMIVFSELAMCGPVHNNPVPLPGPQEAALQAAARKHGVWLITGGVFERLPAGRIVNTCSVIGPDGEVVTRYRKMFPFRPYERDVAAGTEFCVFDVPGVGRFGLSICYDIWFPETTRTLTAMGAEVLLHPVLTGTIDRDVDFSVYDRNSGIDSYLHALGPLAMPQKGSQAGLGGSLHQSTAAEPAGGSHPAELHGDAGIQEAMHGHGNHS